MNKVIPIETKETTDHVKDWSPAEEYYASVTCVSDNGYIHVSVSGYDGENRFDLTGIAPPRVAALLAHAPKLWRENQELKAKLDSLSKPVEV